MPLSLKPLLDLVPLDEESDNSDYTPQRPITGATGTWEEAGDKPDWAAIEANYNRIYQPTGEPDLTLGQTLKEGFGAGMETAAQSPLGLPAKALSFVPRPTAQETQDAWDLITDPLNPGAPSRPPSDAAQAATGAVNVGRGIGEGLVSPIGVATLGMGAAPQALRRLGEAAFAADMLSNVPEQARRAGEASVAGNTQEQVEAFGELGATGLFAGAMGTSALRPVRPTELPRPAVEAIASGHEKGLTKAAEAATESIAKDVVAKEAEAAKAEETPVPEAVAPAPEVAPLTPSPGERLVTIQKPDGTTEQASFGDKYWELDDQKLPSVARWIGDGWSHGLLREGERIVEPITPKTSSINPEISKNANEIGGPTSAKTAPQNTQNVITKETVPERVVVQAEQVLENGETVPGYVTIQSKGNAQSGPIEAWRAVGHEIPDASKMPSGTYTIEELRKLTKEKGAQNGQEEITQEKDNALRQPGVAEAAPEPTKAVEPVGAEPISVGPGAASPGDFPKGSQLSQLTDMLKTQKPLPQASVLGRIEASKRLSDSWAKGKDAVTAGLGKLKAVAQSLTDTYKNLPKWDSYEDAVGKWSGADNASGVEVRNFQKAIHKTIPSRLRQEAITNWIQADGDAAVLKERAAASKPDLRRGYEEALKLTPDEQVFARQIQQYLDSRLQEGVESGLIKNGVENYVTQVWQKENPTTRKLQTDLFGGGNLNPDFKYARKRVFDSYFEGEQAGFAPKDKGIGNLIAHYDTAFNRALSSRSFIKALHDGKAPNGEPIVAVSGKTVPVPKGSEVAEAFLIKPRANDATTKDGRSYRVIDHWALRDWKWSTTGPDGQPVLVQGDLLVHPDYAGNLKNVLGKSALTSREGIASVTTRPLLQASALAKQTKLSLSAFHLTQEGIHGLFHRVNPANIVELDVNAPAQRALMDHGLQVADPRAAELFGEGLAGGGLVGKIPGLGKVQVVFNDWLFKDYIPRLKMTMALDALERNRHAYAKEIKSGKITDDQLQALTSREANAAFGELNYRMMGRNPTVQDFLRLSFLAPDFLEARARFVGQALKPYGREQQLALGFMGAALYVTGRVLNQYLDDKPHWDKPFSVMHNGREYRLRTVLGDVQHLWDDPRRFIYNRLSPAARTIVEGVTSKDDRGINRNFWEQAKDVASWFIPIPVQVRSDETVGEAIGSSVGAGSRKYTARTQLYELADKWKKSNPDPHIQEQYEQARKETRADSPYKTLRDYVEKGDAKAVQEEFNKLLKAHTDKQIFEAFKPKPFTGSKASDRAFYDSLSAEDKKLFERAQEEQDSLRGKLGDMIR